MGIKEEFCSLYREIVESGDEQKMQMLGTVVKKMMKNYIDTNPTKAREYIDMLMATRWKNYLTQKEANDIVQLMVPKARWTYNEWVNTIANKNLEKSYEPVYNEYALYVAMCMVCSDHGKTLEKIASGVNIGAIDMFNTCYDLARDLLMDEDGAFCIRKYFDV